jgi:hypothetical protein
MPYEIEKALRFGENQKVEKGEGLPKKLNEKLRLTSATSNPAVT